MTILSQLEHLERAGLVAATPSSAGPMYLFRHSLIHETTYLTLLRQDRRKLHLAVARLIERLYHNRLDEYAPVLAQHYLEGGDDASALRYLTRSGELSAAVYANDEAALHYAQAVQVAVRMDCPDDVLTDLYSRYGRILELRNRYETALSVYAELEHLGVRKQNQNMLLAALIRQATVQSTPTAFYSPHVALALGERALALARELSDRASESRILWNLMLLHYFGGNSEQSHEYGEQSLVIARELSLREQLAFTLNDMYMSLATTGKLGQAEQTLDEARALWRELGNQHMLCDNLNNTAELLYTRGKLAKALSVLDESVAISQRIMNTWGISYSLMVRGLVLHDQGVLDKAIAAFAESTQQGEAASFVVAMVFPRIVTAVIYVYLGMYERALAVTERAIEITRQRVPGWSNFGLPTRALVYLQQNRLDEAAAELRNLRQLRAEIAPVFPSDIFLLSMLDGMLHYKQSAYHEAIKCFDIYIDQFARLNIPWAYPDCLLLKGRCLLALHQNDDAYRTFQQAHEFVLEHECGRIAHEVLLALSDAELARGHPDSARQHRVAAWLSAQQMADALADPEIRAAFLALPDVHSLLTDVTLRGAL